MRSLRLALAASSVAVLVIACSSSTSAPIAGAVDGGGGSSGSSGGNPPDSSTAPDGGGGDSSSNPDTSTNPDAATAFALTSTAFVEGASIPAENTCNGANTSPALAWTAGPAGTKSYAIVLRDTSNNLIHSVIYDIPPSVMALPAAVPKVYAPAAPAGAHQTKPGFGGGFGYAGPCPPVEHVYEFVLHALGVAALPGADMTTTALAADTLIKANSLGSTKLTGKYKQP